MSLLTIDFNTRFFLAYGLLGIFGLIFLGVVTWMIFKLVKRKIDSKNDNLPDLEGLIEETEIVVPENKVNDDSVFDISDDLENDASSVFLREANAKQKVIADNSGNENTKKRRFFSRN